MTDNTELNKDHLAKDSKTDDDIIELTDKMNEDSDEDVIELTDRSDDRSEKLQANENTIELNTVVTNDTETDPQGSDEIIDLTQTVEEKQDVSSNEEIIELDQVAMETDETDSAANDDIIDLTQVAEEKPAEKPGFRQDETDGMFDLEKDLAEASPTDESFAEELGMPLENKEEDSPEVKQDLTVEASSKEVGEPAEMVYENNSLTAEGSQEEISFKPAAPDTGKGYLTISFQTHKDAARKQKPVMSAAGNGEFGSVIVTEEMIDKALERVIKKLYSEKISKLLDESISQFVKEDMEKIKKLFLTDDATPGE